MSTDSTQPNPTTAATSVASAAPVSPAELREAWQALKATQPHLYPRDAATQLGVSEAQLTALGAGKTSFRLAVPNPAALLNELLRFGAPLFIVRNDDAVLEKTAALTFAEKTTVHGITFASAENDGVSLTFNPSAVASVFATHAEKFVRRGLQFFDAAGTAILKAYIRDDAQVEAFDAWQTGWLSADQSDVQVVSTAAEAAATAAHAHAHIHAHLHAAAHATVATAAATCPHGCASHGTAADARPLAPDSFKTLLTAAAKSGEAVTLGLANAHAFFSVTAERVERVAPVGPWFNVLDEALHTHLREAAVVSATGRVDTASATLRAAYKNAAGKPIFWLRVAANTAAAALTPENLLGGAGI